MAAVIVQLAPLLGKERTMEQLLPLLVRLLKDDVRGRRASEECTRSQSGLDVLWHCNN